MGRLSGCLSRQDGWPQKVAQQWDWCLINTRRPVRQAFMLYVTAITLSSDWTDRSNTGVEVVAPVVIIMPLKHTVTDGWLEILARFRKQSNFTSTSSQAISSAQPRGNQSGACAQRAVTKVKQSPNGCSVRSSIPSYSAHLSLDHDHCYDHIEHQTSTRTTR